MTPSSYLDKTAVPVLSSPVGEASQVEFKEVNHMVVRFKISNPSEYQAGSPLVDASGLYEESADSGQALAVALRLLNRGYDTLSDAYESSVQGELVLADLRMMEMQATAESLFRFRSISATFSMIITALGSAIRSQRGSLFTTEQIFELRGCFSALRSEPFLKDERALALIEKLEAVGLDPISSDYKEFALTTDEG